MALGLAFPGESRGGANERRKPDRRRQSRETGGGFPSGPLRSGLTGALGDGRRFGPTKSHRLTAVRGKRLSALRDVRASVRTERSATGSVRGTSRQPRARPTKPARGGSATLRSPASRSPAMVRATACAGGPTLSSRRQSRAHPGSDCGNAVRRHRLASAVGTSGPGGSAGQVVGAGSPPCARESGDASGARVARSVAEVGEKHLLHGVEGSRETNQEPVG
jgi:hypothetical protein